MYSKKAINLATVVLAIIIFGVTILGLPNNSAIVKAKSNTEEQNTISKEKTEEIQEIQEIQEETSEELTKENTDENNKKILQWSLEIPSISLNAQIAEGTEMATLNKFIGHFTQTSKAEGNIGLAAHNRGFEVNYFKDLDKLQIGDEIIYRYGQNKKNYIVNLNTQISDIDWSYLQDTNENKITLITCIENKPGYRRCIQAIEKF